MSNTRKTCRPIHDKGLIPNGEQAFEDAVSRRARGLWNLSAERPGPP